MKHAVYPEEQGTPTVTSADAAYPIANLINYSRGKKWKAADGVQSATIRLPISADAAVVALDNTNAETIIITITLDSAEQALNVASATNTGGGLVGIPLDGHGYSEGESILLNGTTNYDGVHVLPTQAAGGENEVIITASYEAEVFAGTETACIIVKTTTHTLETASRTFDSFWEEYTEQSAAHHATIKLTAATGETVEAGIIRAGGLATIKNPARKPNESKVKYHIEKKYKDGSEYFKKKTEVRQISYSMVMDRDTLYYDLREMCESFGPAPFMMLITDNDENKHWTIFGKVTSGPNASHIADLSTVTMTVRQVV